MNEKSLKEKILEVENDLKIVIPKVYKEFLCKDLEMEFDEGVLYDVATIAEVYETLEFAEYAPEYIPIGNDNGDYELVMKSGEKTTEFGFLEQGSIGTLKPEHLQSFNEWYEKGAKFSFNHIGKTDEVDWSKKVKIIIKKNPKNEKKILMTIKKAFKINDSISELLAIADNAPCVLTDKYSAAIAKRTISEYHLEDWLESEF